MRRWSSWSVYGATPFGFYLELVKDERRRLINETMTHPERVKKWADTVAGNVSRNEQGRALANAINRMAASTWGVEILPQPSGPAPIKHYEPWSWNEGRSKISEDTGCPGCPRCGYRGQKPPVFEETDWEQRRRDQRAFWALNQEFLTWLPPPPPSWIAKAIDHQKKKRAKS